MCSRALDFVRVKRRLTDYNMLCDETTSSRKKFVNLFGICYARSRLPDNQFGWQTQLLTLRLRMIQAMDQ
jgi:hypothetical protein